MDFEVSKFLTTFSTASHCFARSVCCFDVHSLSSDKERTKKTDFGKPKSQVCLFAKREHRARRGRKHCEPKGRMPFGNPQDFLPWHICRSCWQALKQCTKGFYVYLVFLFAERHGGGFQRRQPLARFLVTSWRVPRSDTKVPHRSARASGAQYDCQKGKQLELLGYCSISAIIFLTKGNLSSSVRSSRSTTGFIFRAITSRKASG